ncbi:MAG: alpha/beta hydrolase-fold protein [Planctomycetota bacterium]
MHRRTTLVLATLLAASILSAQDQEGRGRRRREAQPVELKQFTFREEKFQSEAVGREMEFGIYLPLGYEDEANKDRRYPLVVWLHGMFEDHLRFHHRGGAAVLDKTTADGKLPPCIFVTANGGSTSLYVNRKDQKWEDLVTVDLLAHLAKHYRVAEDRQQRAITGVSMGGMAALRIAFTKPELFGAVGAHSSAVFEEDPEKLPQRIQGMANRLGLDEVFGNPIQKDAWQRANPLCLALNTDSKQLATLRIYFDAGTDDRYGFANGNQLLHEALDKKKVAHTFRLIEGGGHSWGAGFQDQTLPYSFAMIGEMFTAAAKTEHPAGKGKSAAPGGAAGGSPKPANGK